MNNTIDFFYEITKIPRESGNESKIADYICEVAKNNNYEYRRDKYNNVIIKRKIGNIRPIILQAHLDMVCEKNELSTIDFSKEGISAYEENGYITAKNTSLGADNGIGVAQILNILKNTAYSVEAVFTTSEETTMIGAEKIDISDLEGNIMLNLDGFEKDTIVIESAAFKDIILKTNLSRIEKSKKNTYHIKLSGLLGGHSGFDIDKDRGNAIQELAKVLIEIKDIELVDFVGGTKFNVIPSSSSAIIRTNLQINELSKILEQNQKKLQSKYKNINISLDLINSKQASLSEKTSNKYLESINNFKHGVHNTNNNFVTTSINMGVVDLKNNIMKLGMRSSRKKEDNGLMEYLNNYANKYNYELMIQGSQPGFETSYNSELVKKLEESYKKTNESKLVIKPLHITVEAGFFKEKKNDLEVAIISPEIIGAHTPEEKVNINSVKLCDLWLLDFLRAMNEDSNK